MDLTEGSLSLEQIFRGQTLEQLAFLDIGWPPPNL